MEKHYKSFTTHSPTHTYTFAHKNIKVYYIIILSIKKAHVIKECWTFQAACCKSHYELCQQLMIVAVTWILFCFHPELQRQWASQECSWLWVQRAIPSVHLSLTACRYRDPVKLFNMSKWVCFHTPFVSINWWNKKVCMYFQLSYTIYVHVWVWPNQQWFNWVMCWLNHQNTKGKLMLTE